MATTSPAWYRQLGAAGEGCGRNHNLQTGGEPKNLTRGRAGPYPPPLTSLEMEPDARHPSWRARQGVRADGYGRLMPKHPVFVCEACGKHAAQWAGRCASCGAWGQIRERPPEADRRPTSLQSVVPLIEET